MPELQLQQYISRAHALNLSGDGWMDVLWVGQWQHPDGPEKADAEDLALCLENFNYVRSLEGNSWGGLPLYIGHPERKGTADEAPSFAWFMDARINAEGRLQYQPKWVGNSKADLVDSGAYKWISGWIHGWLDDNGIFRPAFVSSVGLTNNPVMKDGQNPMANAGTAAALPWDIRTSPNTGEAQMPKETTEAQRPNAAESGKEAPATPESAAPDPAKQETEKGNATAWWQQFTGKLGELLANAEGENEAREILWNEWDRLDTEMRKVEALQTLLWTVANAFGFEQTSDVELPDAETLVQKANALVDAKSRLEREVKTERDAYNSALVSVAVMQGVIGSDEQSRANALEAVSGNRKAVVSMWNAQAKNVAAQRRSAKLPDDATAGAAFANATDHSQNARQLADRANAYAKEHNISYQEAYPIVSKNPNAK